MRFVVNGWKAVVLALLSAGLVHAQEVRNETSEVPQINAPVRSSAPKTLSHNPEDVGSQLKESAAVADSLFPFGVQTPLVQLWEEMDRKLNQSIGLSVGLNYTMVYQRAEDTINGPRDAMSADLDFYGSWHLIGEEACWPGYLVFDSENRHRYSKIAPNSLNTGTTGGTIDGFNEQDFSLIQFYWEQGSFEQGLIYRVGRMEPALIYDGSRYVSSNYAFLSPAFADTIAMSQPDAGLGMSVGLFPSDLFYAYLGIHDANGSRTRSGFDTFFGEGEFFYALELGLTPNEGTVDEGLYHVTFWHSDAQALAMRPQDQGVAVTLEQQIGCEGNYVPFLRYALAERGLNDIRQNLAVGLGIENVLGKNEDLIGIAAAWQQPSNRSLRDQTIIEAFYRVVITPHSHITPDVQIVFNPAEAPNKNSLAIFGVRFRTLY